MAIDVDNSTFPVGQTTYSHLSLASPIVLNPPFTFASWFRANQYAGSNGATLIVVQGTTFPGTDRLYALFLTYSAAALPNRVAMTADGVLGFPRIAYSAAEYTLNDWHLAVGVVASYTSCKAYLDGVLGSEDTNPSADISAFLTSTRIGATITNIPTFVAPYNGCKAYDWAWSRALTDLEIAELYAGLPPQDMHTGDIVMGLKRTNLATNEVNDFGSNFTVFDPLSRFSTCATSPPIITPTGQRRRWLAEMGPIQRVV